MNKFASSSPLQTQLATDILTALTETILILDPMGRLLFVASSTGDVLGQTPDYWIGRSALDLVHPQDLPTVLERLASGREEPTAFHGSAAIRISSTGNQWLPVEAHAFNPIDFHGTPGILVSIRDRGGSLGFSRSRKIARETMTASSRDASTDSRDVVTQVMLPSMFTETGTGRQLLLVGISLQHHERLVDTYGAARANAAMTELGGVLQRVSRTSDLVARLDNNELLLACPDVSTPVQADMITHRYFDACLASELVPGGFGLRLGYALASQGDDLGEVLGFIASVEHSGASWVERA